MLETSEWDKNLTTKGRQIERRGGEFHGNWILYCLLLSKSSSFFILFQWKLCSCKRVLLLSCLFSSVSHSLLISHPKAKRERRKEPTTRKVPWTKDPDEEEGEKENNITKCIRQDCYSCFPKHQKVNMSRGRRRRVSCFILVKEFPSSPSPPSTHTRKDKRWDMTFDAKKSMNVLHSSCYACLMFWLFFGICSFSLSSSSSGSLVQGSFSSFLFIPFFPNCFALWLPFSCKTWHRSLT